MSLNAPDGGRVQWTFLSNHGNVLLAIARNPDVTLREVAVQVGITERAVQRIVTDLEAGRYLERVRTGRRNRYQVRPELPLRHPIAAHRDIGALIELVVDARTCGDAPALHAGVSDPPCDPAEACRPAPEPVESEPLGSR